MNLFSTHVQKTHWDVCETLVPVVKNWCLHEQILIPYTLTHCVVLKKCIDVASRDVVSGHCGDGLTVGIDVLSGLFPTLMMSWYYESTSGKKCSLQLSPTAWRVVLSWGSCAVLGYGYHPVCLADCCHCRRKVCSAGGTQGRKRWEGPHGKGAVPPSRDLISLETKCAWNKRLCEVVETEWVAKGNWKMLSVNKS